MASFLGGSLFGGDGIIRRMTIYTKMYVSQFVRLATLSKNNQEKIWNFLVMITSFRIVSLAFVNEILNLK